MKTPLLSRLFRGKSEASYEEESIVLADFDLHPARTINVTPGVEPSAAAPDPAREAAKEQLSSVVERLASGMV